MDFDERFVFEPQPWDIASAVGLDSESCAELDELADAMLMWAQETRPRS
jgi:hypothetical protein